VPYLKNVGLRQNKILESIMLIFAHTVPNFMLLEMSSVWKLGSVRQGILQPIQRNYASRFWGIWFRNMVIFPRTNIIPH